MYMNPCFRLFALLPILLGLIMIASCGGSDDDDTDSDAEETEQAMMEGEQDESSDEMNDDEDASARNSEQDQDQADSEQDDQGQGDQDQDQGDQEQDQDDGQDQQDQNQNQQQDQNQQQNASQSGGGRGTCDLAGNWSGVYYNDVSGERVGVNATVTTEGFNIVIRTNKPYPPGQFFTGTINGQCGITLIDASDGEDWSTKFGAADGNQLRIADWVVQDRDPVTGRDPLNIIELYR